MIYVDASVIVKRYYDEAGSDRVRAGWESSERVFTSRVAYAEVHAAFARKRRDGELSTAAFRESAATFETEWPAYDQVLVAEQTLMDVRRLVQRHGLRGFDAIHLAAALWVKRQLGAPLEFWVADERLETAARRERLVIVNPGND